MAHVAEFKKRIVKDLSKLFKEYPIIGMLDMENLPAPQLQQMRAQLRDKVVMTMTKRRIINIAIDQCKDVKGIEQIKKYLIGMPALLFTKEDPFKLNKQLQKAKSKAPAKAGQIAPNDITINAGPTPFAPGPIIGELAQIGLKTGVESNKVVVKEDKVVVKKGDSISQEIASILLRLNIKPMEIGLNLLAVLEKGEIIVKEILTVSEEEYLENLQKAHQWAFNLSVEAGLVNKDNVEFLITKAFNEAKTLAFEGNIISDVVVADMLSKAERTALDIKETGNIETEVKEVPKVEEKPKVEVKPEVKVTSEPKQEVKKEQPKVEVKKDIRKVEEKKIEVKKEVKEQPKEVKQEKPKVEKKKVKKEEPKVEEKKDVPKVEEKKKEEPKDRVDQKVDDMVKKAKDFAAGKKVTADDLLED